MRRHATSITCAAPPLRTLDATLRERLGQHRAEGSSLLGNRRSGRNRVFGVYVYVPQAGHEVRAVKVYDCRAARVGRVGAIQDLGDTSVLDRNARLGKHDGINAIDNVGVG